MDGLCKGCKLDTEYVVDTTRSKIPFLHEMAVPSKLQIRSERQSATELSDRLTVELFFDGVFFVVIGFIPTAGGRGGRRAILAFGTAPELS